jgi:hypothetical protein
MMTVVTTDHMVTCGEKKFANGGARCQNIAGGKAQGISPSHFAKKNGQIILKFSKLYNGVNFQARTIIFGSK